MDEFDIQYTTMADDAIDCATMLAEERNHAFVTPEHLLYELIVQEPFVTAIDWSGMDAGALEKGLTERLSLMPIKAANAKSVMSFQMLELLDEARKIALQADAAEIDVPKLVKALLSLKDSWAAYLLQNMAGPGMAELIANLISAYQEKGENEGFDYDYAQGADSAMQGKPEAVKWKQYVTCVNDRVADHNPLIGREAELQRTMQVLCRKDKNNPLHLGEPGVGKTSIVYGLADRIERGEVPESLRGCRIYQVDMGTLLAGTQYRGDFEARLTAIMRGVEKEGNAIVYIDEIHGIVGAGRTGDGSVDAANILKPFLEGGKVRFIGSTTHEEYTRQLTRSKGMIRRFQVIDIQEPSIDETIQIIQALKPQYEAFHGVNYDDDAIALAVRASAKHITDRFLPDKAIDLIDEAGAYLKMQEHADDAATPRVDSDLIAQVLARVARVDALQVRDDDTQRLASLRERITSTVFGQDKAVDSVVEAVQMAKAGLGDDNKPLASLLFVGPTGVGKTEVAKTLARELGVKLVRFDMSEYAEKHTVAKFIGAPSGYVGYDDGGLLTDAVRRNPDCVLLFDEIEKAHPDIFDILLQVMDYAVLTDNKGRKAHFHNVVLIMTSNAGAQWAAQATVGFASQVTTGSAMLTQVKKTFKPEFINRLSGVVVFNDMSRDMASLILDKKLRELEAKLADKQVTMHLSDAARNHLLDEGFSRQYGAREMDRVISQQLKTLLMREILFGKLGNGGDAYVDCVDDKLVLS